MNNSKDIPGCPIRFATGLFGDKWTLLIIRDLMFKGRHYYSEFLEAGEGISSNILADRLAKLAANGIVDKQRDSVKRSKFFYDLTEKGLDLVPVMLAIMDWAQRYDEETLVPKEFIGEYRRNRTRFEKKLRQQSASQHD